MFGYVCIVLFRGVSYQSLHGSVESMPVVPPELGVGSLERRVPGGLGLLNTVVVIVVSNMVGSHSVLRLFRSSTYPFR